MQYVTVMYKRLIVMLVRWCAVYLLNIQSTLGNFLLEIEDVKIVCEQNTVKLKMQWAEFDNCGRGSA